VAARETMDDAQLRELAEDIARNGLLQPISVFAKPVDVDGKDLPGASTVPSPADGGGVRYEIIAGHRRYVAHQQLGKYEIQALVFPSRPDNSEALKLSENLCREDLNDGEIAIYLAELADKYGYNEEQLCAVVRRSADWVGDRVRLFRGDERVLEALRKRQINFGVARELNKCPDGEMRNYYLQQAVASGCSVRVVADWIRDYKVQHYTAAPAPAETAAAEQPAPPAVQPVECFCCGGNRDPWNIEMRYIHKHCAESVIRAMARAGEGD